MYSETQLPQSNQESQKVMIINRMFWDYLDYEGLVSPHPKNTAVRGSVNSCKRWKQENTMELK